MSRRQNAHGRHGDRVWPCRLLEYLEVHVTDEETFSMVMQHLHALPAQREPALEQLVEAPDSRVDELGLTPLADRLNTILMEGLINSIVAALSCTVIMHIKCV